MSGLNSISGLNKVNIDYRPEVGPAGKQQGQNEIVADVAQPNQQPAGTAKSILKQLDVLMLNAARRSVVNDMGRKVAPERQLLLDWGVPAERVDRIESLAKDATEKLQALTMTVGAQSVALPDVIDEEMYNKLMELAANDDAKAEYFATIAPRLSPEALDAAKLRLEDAIAHARKLHDDGKVVKEDGWPAIANAERPDGVGTKLTVTKVSKEVVEVSPELFNEDPREKRFVQDCIKGSAPSYYLRDGLDKLFDVV